MKPIYDTDLGFAHAVRYNDGLLNAWLKRTGRGNVWHSTDELPPWIDYPSNDDRGRAERIRFTSRPLQHGESYIAYFGVPSSEHIASYAHDHGHLGKGVITTFNGELLAIVTRVTSYRVRSGYVTDERGSFWAKGIDGRTYYGRHNGRGMYCGLRLAKWVDEYEIQQRTPEGWEAVNTETTWREAKLSLDEYRENAPGSYRIKRNKVRQS